jgi:serine/threonine protein kinase
MGLLDQFKSILTGGRTDVRAKYEIVREVESGTMSKFYKARDKLTGKIVGLKILDPKKTADFEARFKGLNKPSEGEILSQLNHLRIVKCIEHGLTSKGERFLVMEYVDGQGLDLLIIGRSPLLAERRLPIIRQAAEAVQAVHDAGFIHRDVCPRNFMVDPQGHNLKLIDFGLTVPATAPFMQPGNRTGNPNYMAPELVKRQPTSPRLDQFAFGVSMYELCTAQLPWPRGEDGLVAMKHAERPAVPIEKYRPQIEPRLSKAIMRSIEREPDKRFESLNDLLKAIADVKSVDVQ